MSNTTTKEISIYADGVFAGSGMVRITEGYASIDDCPAVLGEGVYDDIEAAIYAGLDSIDVESITYTWELT